MPEHTKVSLRWNKEELHLEVLDENEVVIAVIEVDSITPEGYRHPDQEDNDNA